MWIDVEPDELMAVIEAAEAGQKAGGLKRSAKKLDRGLEQLRNNAEFHNSQRKKARNAQA